MAANANARATGDGNADSGRSEVGTSHIVGCCAVRTLVVLPTYNEAANIDDVLRRIRSSLPEAAVLVVDDASPDGTGNLAAALGDELGQISVLRRTAKEGLGAAYKAGFALGIADGAEILVEMDADLSHDPLALPAIVSAVRYGADLVIGSRYVPGGSIPNWSFGRRWLSRWGNRYAAGVLGLAVNDATSGYRAYRASMLQQLDLEAVRADGYAFQIEMTYRVVRLSGSVVELPISFIDRARGTSKMSSRIVFEALLLVTGWGVRDRMVSLRTRRRRQGMRARG